MMQDVSRETSLRQWKSRRFRQNVPCGTLPS
jgi:hypothetical protein